MSAGALIGIASGVAVIVTAVIAYAKFMVLAPLVSENARIETEKARTETEKAQAEAARADAERESTRDRERFAETDAKLNSLQQDMVNLKLGKTNAFLKYEIDTTLLQATQALGVTESSISLPSPPPNASWFVFLSANGPAAANLRLAKVKIDDGIGGRVFTTGTLHNTKNAHGDPHFFPGIDKKGEHETRAMLTVPLNHNGKTVGVAQFLNKPAGFSESDEVRATEFAGLLAGKVATFAGDPENFELLGLAGLVDDKEATIAFCDLTSFSPLLDQMNTPSAVDCLNEYLAQQCDVAMRHGGTVEKYLGDGAMLRFLPAPGLEQDTVVHVVEVALEMQDVFERLKDNWLSSALPVRDIYSRIGISCGIVHEAKIGHPQFRELTVIGKAVNEASALCEAARRDGHVISVPGHLVGRLSDRFALAAAPAEGSRLSPYEVIGRA
jgi:class 3 adenylate cyclase